MSILVSQKILNRIHDELSKSKESFLLISAYCKLSLIKYFDECIADSGIEKKLVVRFRLEDLRSGASDLSIYPYCKEHGWKLYFRLDLHAKTYVFDRLRCIIGSANATSSGLNVGGVGNYEIATACDLAEKDLHTLDLLLLGAVEMNDCIYEMMQSALTHLSHNSELISWPDEIIDKFRPDYSLLFAEDFPACSHPIEASEDDLLFLNLPADASIETIKNAFYRSKCFLWLYNLVKKQEGHEMHFGAITAKLHDVLLNEPKPYRKNVKQLLSNLLSWIVDLNTIDIQVDRPNHSQRVLYISQEV